MLKVSSAFASIFVILVSACSPSQVVKAVAPNSPRALASEVANTGAVKISVELGRANGKASDGFRTGFFNMTSSYNTINQPYRVHISLDDSATAKLVREKGIPLFIYAIPDVEYTRVFNNNGKSTKKREAVSFPDHSGRCDGFKMVLNRENNYTIDVTYSQKVTIRKKSSGTNFGVWGTHGATDWTVTGAEGKGRILGVKHKPFLVGTRRSNFRYDSNEYAPPLRVSVDDDNACVYAPQRRFF